MWHINKLFELEIKCQTRIKEDNKDANSQIVCLYMYDILVEELKASAHSFKRLLHGF